MSNLVFPSFQGIDLAIKRRAIYATKVQTSASGKELRASFQSTPRYAYELKFNFLRQAGYQTVQDEVAQLGSFFTGLLGSWDSFLFTDPVDSSVVLQSIGTGTGSKLTFQLCDEIGVPVKDLNGAASIYVNGVLKTLTTDYTINSSGVVTFVAAPANGLSVTWSGAFYRRVRFVDDQLELEQILNLCWSGGTAKLILVK